MSKTGLTVNITIETTEASILDQVSVWADSYVNKAAGAVTQWRMAGVSEAVIEKRITEMWESKNGIFAGWNGGAGGIAAGAINTIQHNAYLSEMATKLDLKDSTLWEWVLDSGAKHCDTCPTHPGQGPLTYLEWEAIGLPGAGMDDCGSRCRCDIIPVDVLAAIG